MIYFENAAHGKEGFSTHVMSYTLCEAISDFLDRDFYFAFEIPSSTPPAFAFKPEYKKKFEILLNSRRSRVSQLLIGKGRRRASIRLDMPNRVHYQLLYSHFLTTEAMKQQFGGSIVWDSFAMGRHGHTREELAEFELIAWTHTKVCTPHYFFFLPKADKQELLDKFKVRFLPEIEDLASDVIAALGHFDACHLRLGDFLKNYSGDEYSLNVDLFRDYAMANFQDDSRAVVLATDGLDQKLELATIFPGRRLIFLDEFIFDRFGDRFRTLPFTDFNVLSILDQLVCSAADSFIGTFRSTFSAIIHRMRQERYLKKDFRFWPDGRVARQLSKDLKVSPDRSGFFDWNRYSYLAADNESAAWKCEWDHDLTALDL